MSANSYGGLIWTNHALERLAQRGLPQDLAWQAYRYPDDVKKDTYKNSTTYLKKHEKYLISLIIKENERKELIVVSAWIDPPMFGTKDYAQKQQYKQYQKSGFWGKIWQVVKKQIGF